MRPRSSAGKWLTSTRRKGSACRMNRADRTAIRTTIRAAIKARSRGEPLSPQHKAVFAQIARLRKVEGDQAAKRVLSWVYGTRWIFLSALAKARFASGLIPALKPCDGSSRLTLEVDGVGSNGFVGFPKFRQVCHFLGYLPHSFFSKVAPQLLQLSTPLLLRGNNGFCERFSFFNRQHY
jgi:hypothetical protein